MTTDSGETGATSSVTFSTHFVVQHSNHTIGILGSIHELGNWRPKSTVVLSTQGNNVWERILTLPTSCTFEWKLVLYDISSYSVLRWEETSNRSLQIFGAHPFVLKCYWGFPGQSEIKHILLKEYTDTTGLDTKNKTTNKKGSIKIKKLRSTTKNNSEKESVNRHIYFSEDSSDMEYLINEEDTKDADKYIDKLASKYSREKKLVNQLKHLNGTGKKAQAPLHSGEDIARKPVILQKTNHNASKQRTHLSLSICVDNCNSGNNNDVNTTSSGGHTDQSLNTREFESTINKFCASQRCAHQHCNHIGIAGIPPADGDENRHQSKTPCCMFEGPPSLNKHLNVLELKHIFEGLSKQVNENKENHWSKDQTLLLQKKRVQILKRLIMMKINSENHSEEYRQAKLKSISALTYAANQVETTDGETVNVFDLLEVDKNIFENLYSELRLKDDTKHSPRSADSMNDRDISHSTNVKDVSDSRNDTDISVSAFVSAVASGSSTSSDEPIRPYGHDECPWVQSSAAIGGNDECPWVQNSTAIYRNDECPLVQNSTAIYGNDECPSDHNSPESQNIGFFSLCRENKTAVFTSAALGLSLTVGIAFLKLRK